MTYAWQAVVAAAGMAAMMLAAMEAGRRWGLRRARVLGEDPTLGLSGIDAGIYGLLGLLLGFSFSAAEGRLETRRAQIVEEYNAVGTAYLRFDVLEPADRERARAATRRYLDARLRVYENLGDRAASNRALAEAAALQSGVWASAVDGVRRAKLPAAAILVVPAVNAMLDAATPRTVALDARTPKPVWALLLVLGPLSALLAGYAMSERQRRSGAHMILFSGIIAVTFYVIVDLDSTRFGLVRLQGEERMLEQLRATLK